MRQIAQVFLVLVCGLSAMVGAQTIAPHPRDLSFELLEFEPPDPARHRYTLSNGVVVFVVEDHTLPLVTVSVVIRAGDYLDPPGKIGVAGLVGSQMRTGGAGRLSAADFDEEVAFLAAQLGSSISETRGRASVNALTKDLDAALDLFFDMLRHPRFNQARLDLAKSQILQQMERRNDSTRSIEGREWDRLMRGDDHFSTRPTTRASNESITRDDLIAFHQRYYQPGGLIFAVSGDVTPDLILQELEARMSDWPANGNEVPSVPKPAHTPRPGLYLVDKSDVNQGRVTVGHLGVTRDNPDRYPLIVMNDILGGGGFSSRIMTRVRSDEGLAYSAGSHFVLGTYYNGVFTAGFQSRSETVARASAIVLEEIERIRMEPVSNEELQNSIASFVETFTRSFSTATATANLFADDEYTGRDPDYLVRYRQLISAVTAADVLRVAKEYLHPDRLVMLVVGNQEAIAAGDPDNPDYVLEGLIGSGVTQIRLPDPFTMEYPTEP